MSLLKSKMMAICIICGAILAIMALSHSVHGSECASLGGGCDDGGWDPMQKLEEIGNPTIGQQQAPTRWPEKSRTVRWNQSASGFEDLENNSPRNIKNAEAPKITQNANPTGNAAVNMSIIRSDEAKQILVPLEDVADSDILLDVSENSSIHIAESIVIPYMEFDEQAGVLKNVSELSKILGDAGISNEDSVVIYGECLPCGGGPSVATYVYWMMKGLGHEKVKVLDGTAEDWAASGRATSRDGKILSGKIYIPEKSANYTATYDLIKSGRSQIVDARSWQEFGSGTIPGSINIPYGSVLDGKKIKSEDQLNKVFMILDKDQPITVFTNTGMKGSVVWFALMMMDYNAKLYNYREWIENQDTRGDIPIGD
jgi:thiosulfate/3-mercaptopyruvate sulfurtransferase